MRVFHDTDSQMTDSYQATGYAGGAYKPERFAAAELESPYHRRSAPRARTVFRIAPVTVQDGQGLARVRNISDGGMMLNTALPVMLGDRVSVALSESQTLCGTVVWTNGNDCGLRFDEPIDSMAALHASCEEARSPDARAPRFAIDKTALARTERGLRAVRLRDVSQRGCKVEHDGSFTPGINVKLTMPSGVERRGVVRWSRDGVAGIMLTEPLGPRELGNVGTL